MNWKNLRKSNFQVRVKVKLRSMKWKQRIIVMFSLASNKQMTMIIEKKANKLNYLKAKNRFVHLQQFMRKNLKKVSVVQYQTSMVLYQTPSHQLLMIAIAKALIFLTITIKTTLTSFKEKTQSSKTSTNFLHHISLKTVKNKKIT